MTEADRQWAELQQKHEDFKSSWHQDTRKYKEQYKVEEITETETESSQNIPTEHSEQPLEKALKQIEELKQQLAAADVNLRDQQTKVGALQTRLIDKTEEASANHTKYAEQKHRVDLFKVKFDKFLANHENIDGQDQMVEMLGEL